MSSFGNTRYASTPERPRIAPPKGPTRAIWDSQIADGKAREAAERRANKRGNQSAPAL